MCTPRCHLSVGLRLEPLAPFPFEDPPDSIGCFLNFSGFGNPGWRVATAFKSVRSSISVSGFTPAQGDPEERPLWTCGMGVCLYLPCLEMYVPGLMPKLFAKTC